MIQAYADAAQLSDLTLPSAWGDVAGTSRFIRLYSFAHRWHAGAAQWSGLTSCDLLGAM